MAHFTLLACKARDPGAGARTVPPRERLSLNDGWRFFKYVSPEQADALAYDVRPAVADAQDNRAADAQPTEAVRLAASRSVLRPWILPTGNAFIADPERRHVRPDGSPGSDFPFVQRAFDDAAWLGVQLPHDWAIQGPFFTEPDAEVGGGMGRLPSPGIAWYRKALHIPESDRGRSLFLEVDGAMSYAMVWLNGVLVGGWPNGYSSWQVELTPYVVPGAENQLAIRLDNPPTPRAGILAAGSIATCG